MKFLLNLFKRKKQTTKRSSAKQQGKKAATKSTKGGEHRSANNRKPYNRNNKSGQGRKEAKPNNNNTPPQVEVTQELKHKIFTIFNSNPQLSFNGKQISGRLATMDIDVDFKVCESALKELFQENVIEKREDKKWSYRLKRTHLRTEIGKVDMTASGLAYIVVEDAPVGEKDIIVEARRTMRAMHGDRVKVSVIGHRRDGRVEGEVIEILEQGKRKFVGTMELSERFGFVKVDSRQLAQDVFVHIDNINGAQDGQKVLVEVVDWPRESSKPVGQILAVLGDSGDNNTEMHAILAQYDLPYSFPEELEQLADKIDAGITPQEVAKRRDMRGITTFTIDPADAKDFDDALSIQKLPNGNWEIGVHIADVTHYVLPDDRIDTEGYARATSVYLVDRTVPMLPEKLSNFLCSLRPHEEKLAFSAIFEMNDQAEIKAEWIGRTVIYSDHRFTYEDAQEIIEQGAENTHPLKEEVLNMDRLAKILRKKRFQEGSIGFERDEAKFVLDENGVPLSVYFKQMKDSNQLVEEFMLQANRTVAEFIGKKKNAGGKTKTFIYRIHDTPDPEKLEKFRSFITRFGYNIKATEGTELSKEITGVLTEIKGKAEENLVSTLAIRSMAKATYTTNNIGHYGLAFPYYSHFTSPIRRYPDMMVHRLLQHYLDGGASANAAEYEEKCEWSTKREILAAEAERTSIKYKMVEFMQDKLGTEWEGVISGVTDWGLYVELCENKIEGMVALRDMADDFYAFDNESYSVIGHRTGRRFTLGDTVRIKIARTDLGRKQLDFEMIGTVDFTTREFTPMPEPDPTIERPQRREDSNRNSNRNSNRKYSNKRNGNNKRRN